MTVKHAWNMIESVVNDKLHEWNLNVQYRSDLRTAVTIIERVIKERIAAAAAAVKEQADEQ